MNMPLHWDRLHEVVHEALGHGKGRIVIVSPYITTSLVALPNATDLFGNEVTILTSWKDSNLIQGSSSLDLYPVCRDNGWELRVLDNLHAKVYATMRSEMWVGSANLTASGMGLSANPNHEVLTRVDADESDWVALDSLVASGTRVDAELHGAYSEWLAQQPEYSPPGFEPFVAPERGAIYTLEMMPLTFTPIELHETLSAPDSVSELELADARRDLVTFGVAYSGDLEEFLDSLRPRFFGNPLVGHMLDQIGEEWVRFGAMRTMMREARGGIDVVSRDDVTRFTQNLYEWVEDLDDSGDFEFGIPRHSQLIRRIP